MVGSCGVDGSSGGNEGRGNSNGGDGGGSDGCVDDGAKLPVRVN